MKRQFFSLFGTRPPSSFHIEQRLHFTLRCARVTVLEVIQRSTEFLARKGVESPRLQVELLLGHVLKVPRLRLYLDFERILAEPELDLLRELIKRRGTREPLQHILGSTSFCGLEMSVTPDVLIPRPETEVLAERAWQWLESRVAAGRETQTALDFGTGSGCIAVSVAVHVPQAKVLALDVSLAALKIAIGNAALHGVSERLQFFEGHGLHVLPREVRFDLVVANPPYIPTAEISTLAPEVREHDPRLALDGGADGLFFYRRLATETRPYLVERGKLMAEFGDGQAPALQSIFEAAGWVIEEIAPDLSGRPRIMIARRAES